jgi:alginate O-acetyltransferase complex protein AlgI
LAFPGNLVGRDFRLVFPSRTYRPSQATRLSQFCRFLRADCRWPIERRADLLPQIEGFKLHWNLHRINKGLSLIVLGFFFKACLADNLASLVVALRTNFENVYLIWATNICFGFQVYFDFAGYSFIALGLGKILGIELTLNFRSPYWSTSIQEFWRRWHVTLSRWFRDYLYILLVGEEPGSGSSTF